MVEIVDIDFQLAWREMKRLPTFEEQCDYVAGLLVKMMRNVTNLARAIAKLQDGKGRLGEELKSIKKMVDYGISRNGVIKDVLKRKSKSMMDREFFTKEVDLVKKMTKELSYVV